MTKETHLLFTLFKKKMYIAFLTVNLDFLPPIMKSDQGQGKLSTHLYQPFTADHTSFPLLQAVKEQSNRASSPTTTKISPHSSLLSLQTFLSICRIFKRPQSPCKCFPIVSRAIKFVFREIWQVCFAESPALFSLSQAPFHQVFSSYRKSSFNRSLYSAWPDNSCIANHRKTGRENWV